MNWLSAARFLLNSARRDSRVDRMRVLLASTIALGEPAAGAAWPGAAVAWANANEGAPAIRAEARTVTIRERFISWSRRRGRLVRPGGNRERRRRRAWPRPRRRHCRLVRHRR